MDRGQAPSCLATRAAHCRFLYKLSLLSLLSDRTGKTHESVTNVTGACSRSTEPTVQAKSALNGTYCVFTTLKHAITLIHSHTYTHTHTHTHTHI